MGMGLVFHCLNTPALSKVTLPVSAYVQYMCLISALCYGEVHKVPLARSHRLSRSAGGYGLFVFIELFTPLPCKAPPSLPDKPKVNPPSTPLSPQPKCLKGFFCTFTAYVYIYLFIWYVYVYLFYGAACL